MSKIQREAMEGPGYLEYQLRTNFRDLVRVIGFDNARAEVAEIILSEANRKRITIDG
ncbi:hypothetical protein [Mesorhizobium sp.]|uniref:hypothetical protein n=1 Tax=Mesorhizobium sp. TaxID=1871066 RepID=UPI0025BE3FB0|nr:hypothetical protein [Mesorhizobium sp.]